MLPAPVQPAVVRRTEGSQAGHSLPLSPLCASYRNHGRSSVASLCSGSVVTAGAWALSLRDHGGASRRPVPKVPGAAVTPVRHRAWHGRRLSSAVARSQHRCSPASTPASPAQTLGYRPPPLATVLGCVRHCGWGQGPEAPCMCPQGTLPLAVRPIGPQTSPGSPQPLLAPGREMLAQTSGLPPGDTDGGGRSPWEPWPASQHTGDGNKHLGHRGHRRRGHRPGIWRDSPHSPCCVLDGFSRRFLAPAS